MRPAWLVIWPKEVQTGLGDFRMWARISPGLSLESCHLVLKMRDRLQKEPRGSVKGAWFLRRGRSVMVGGSESPLRLIVPPGVQTVLGKVIVEDDSNPP